MKNTNRVIKFRAWDKEAKKMIIFCLEDLLDLQNKTETESFGIHDYACNRMYETIMQFTGLLDKNGKEIYEGDIVKGDWSIVNDIESGVVEFYGGAFRYKPAGLPLEFGYYRKECEVIGNIYQNPELIN